MIQPQSYYSYVLRCKLQEFVCVLVLRQPIIKPGQDQSAPWCHQLEKQILFYDSKDVLDWISEPISIQQHDSFLTPSFPNSWIALDVFLKLRPKKYKYNAYNIVSADILSRSTKLIEYGRMFVAIAL